jgi:hypothetical protein
MSRELHDLFRLKDYVILCETFTLPLHAAREILNGCPVGGYMTNRGKLAPASRRSDRTYDAAAADGGLRSPFVLETATGLCRGCSTPSSAIKSIASAVDVIRTLVINLVSTFPSKKHLVKTPLLGSRYGDARTYDVCAHRHHAGIESPLRSRGTARNPRRYFNFFGTRFFCLGPDPPGASASSPRHGQASLNAASARVIPGSFNRSGFWSRYRNMTLALSKMLPCAGGHPRTSAGRFGEKIIAVSTIPSHEPADRALSKSANLPSISSWQDLCASAPVSTTVPQAFPMTESARPATMI